MIIVKKMMPVNYFFSSKVAESFVDVDEVSTSGRFLAHSFIDHFLRRQDSAVGLQRRNAAARRRQVCVTFGVTQLSTEIF